MSARAFEPFLEVLVALWCTACRLPADDERHEDPADPVPLEVHDNRHPRPGVVGERFDGQLDVRPDRPVDPVRGPVGGGMVSVISCVIARALRPIRRMVVNREPTPGV